MRNGSGSMAQRNEADCEMVQDQQRTEEQNRQARDRTDDPETMDHFEFMNKTVKKLQARIDSIDSLITSTEKRLDSSTKNIRDKISNEKAEWVKKHPEMLEQHETSINN